MVNIAAAFQEFWNNLKSVLTSFNFPIDLIDIAVTAFVIYHAVRLVRETRAMQLLKGIIAILAVYLFASELGMIVIGFFTQNIIQVGIFLLVVLFQPELRSALEKMGRTQLSLRHFTGSRDEKARMATKELIDTLTESCLYLSENKTGALIVIERQTRLGDVIKTGTMIDSVLSLELIGNIFFLNSPLHDGAMIIRDHRLHAAGCYLPLSQNMEIGRELGTRHRAALGLSEVSDAVVLVVSEETGAITMAVDSRLQRGLSKKNLRKLLELKLLGDAKKAEESPKKRKDLRFWKVKK